MKFDISESQQPDLVDIANALMEDAIAQHPGIYTRVNRDQFGPSVSVFLDMPDGMSEVMKVLVRAGRLYLSIWHTAVLVQKIGENPKVSAQMSEIVERVEERGFNPNDPEEVDQFQGTIRDVITLWDMANREAPTTHPDP